MRRLLGAPTRSIGRAAGIAERMRRRGEPSIDRSDWYAEQWSSAATARDRPVRHVGPGRLAIGAGATPLLVAGADTSVQDRATYELAGDKAASGRLLAEEGIPVPSWTTHALGSRSLLNVVRTAHPTVIKPSADTGGGRGITVGPPNRTLAARACLEAGARTGQVIVQTAVEGDVARVLVLDGSVLDAVVRTPAAVIGDGTSSVGELVDAENARRVGLGAAATGFIATSTDYACALARAGVDDATIPRAGQRITVSGRSNSGSELESHRRSLTPAAEEMATGAAEALGIRLAGVDIVLGRDGDPKWVLEVNTTPGLHWHRLVVGDPAPVFEAIVERLSSASA